MSIDHDEIHIEAKRCADVIGVTPYSDMRPFVERAVIVALSDERLRNAEIMEFNEKELAKLQEYFLAAEDVFEYGEAAAPTRMIRRLHAARAALNDEVGK